MKITYQYFRDRGYVLCAPEGVITADDIKTYATALSTDSSIDMPFFEIADLSNVEAFAFETSETDDLLALFRDLISKKGYRGSCLVAQGDLAKGVSNLISNVGREMDISIKVFNTVEAASQYAEFNKAY